jgi:hypothetical protein
MAPPSLVDLSKYNIQKDFSLMSGGKSKLPFLEPLKNAAPKKKWNLNKILLVGFCVFSVFFLYNCKYGIFKYDDPVLPYKLQ